MCNTFPNGTMTQQKSSRNPAGIIKDKPIALRLMPKELANAERISGKLGLSRSALARKAYLAGLPIVEKELLRAS